MRTVDIREAEENLDRLVQEAVDGAPFVITRDGKPVVKVVPVEAPFSTAARKTGFLAGEISVPADFDRMGAAEVEALFQADG